MLAEMIRFLLQFSVFLALAYVVVTIFMYFYQDKMVFVPTRNSVMTPDEFGIKFEEVSLRVSEQDSIHGWYFPVDSSAPTILFCYGNAGNKSRRMISIQFFIEQGLNLVIFDYRGYGQSDGKPGETNCYDDVERVYRWLVDEKKISPKKIIIFGRSLGGAIAIELATRVECAGLIVESSFTSIPDMSRLMFPYMFTDQLTKNKFDSIKKIKSVECPLLVTHSVEDDLIPFSMGRKLFEQGAEPKMFFELTGRHNDRDFLRDSAYIQTIKEFVQNTGEEK